MVARNGDARKRSRLEKRRRSQKRQRSRRLMGLAEALAARISATIDWTAGDSAICLARQAGPGPRI
jgi:hypothetical protein